MRESDVMDIQKSSRHSRIAGDFAEHLVLYWLSKYGFECARIDHTGIDLLAVNPDTRERMGISVKGRTRNIGKEKVSVNIPRDDVEKARRACQFFGAEPYFAIVVDEGNKLHAFIVPMDEVVKTRPENPKVYAWRMTPKHIESYRSNPDIRIFEFNHSTYRWWEKTAVLGTNRR